MQVPPSTRRFATIKAHVRIPVFANGDIDYARKKRARYLISPAQTE